MSISAIFKSEEFKEFKQFLADVNVIMKVSEGPEEMKTYFYFRTKIRRILPPCECAYTPISELIPDYGRQYELVTLQACIAFKTTELRERKSSDVIEELKAYVIQEFHLNEAEMTFGNYKYVH